MRINTHYEVNDEKFIELINKLLVVASQTYKYDSELLDCDQEGIYKALIELGKALNPGAGKRLTIAYPLDGTTPLLRIEDEVQAIIDLPINDKEDND